MKKIGIIGFFGGNKKFYDGQTIKTKNLEALLTKYGEYSVYKVDTFLLRKNPILLMFKTIKSLFLCNHIFLLVSVKGMNFYLRFFYLANKIFKKQKCICFFRGNRYDSNIRRGESRIIEW